MANTDTTTVQVDIDTRDKLRILAERNYRNMAAHLKFMVERDYAELQQPNGNGQTGSVDSTDKGESNG